VVKLDAGKKTRVAGNVGDDETGGFWLRQHGRAPQLSTETGQS
jgi:hypothetical protein